MRHFVFTCRTRPVPSKVLLSKSAKVVGHQSQYRNVFDRVGCRRQPISARQNWGQDAPPTGIKPRESYGKSFWPLCTGNGVFRAGRNLAAIPTCVMFWRPRRERSALTSVPHRLQIRAPQTCGGQKASCPTGDGQPVQFDATGKLGRDLLIWIPAINMHVSCSPLLDMARDLRKLAGDRHLWRQNTATRRTRNVRLVPA